MNWKSIKEYLPYFSGLIILLGLLRQMVYYIHFNIPIQNYIGVSELLLAWIDESFLFFTNLIILIFYMRFLSVGSNFNLNRLGKIIFPLFAIFLFYQFINLLISRQYYSSITFLIIIFVSLYPLAGWIINIVLKKTPIKLAYFQLIYFSICVILIFILVTRNTLKYVDDGKYIGTKIYTNDSTYVSDSTHFFIGKTENFYFIHNKDKKSTLVIPEREVSKFELQVHYPYKK